MGSRHDEITIEESADNSSFAAVSGLSPLVVTGGTGNGAAAATRSVRLAPAVKRYVRATAAVLTGGGDNTAKTFSLAVLV